MRKHRTDQSAPPLACWVCIGLIAALAVFAFSATAEHVKVPGSEAFGDFNVARFSDAQSHARTDALNIVMFGNSRLKYATWGEQRLATLAAGDRPLKVYRFVHDWAVFEDFEPVLDSVIELQPDLVVFQTDLLTQDRSLAAKIRLVREYWKWWLFGGVGESWNPYDLNQSEMQFATPCAEIAPKAAAVDARMARTGRWLMHDPNSRSAQAAGDFMHELSEMGIRVAMLTIPRTAVMEARRPELEITAERVGAYSTWRYPEAIADEHFCDTIHLNAEGRAAYSAWLEEQIRQLPAMHASR